MSARSVQISLPADLLTRIDGTVEARRDGRSAVIQKAVRFYLDHDRRRAIDAAYAKAYGGKADAVNDEFSPLGEEQASPARCRWE